MGKIFFMHRDGIKFLLIGIGLFFGTGIFFLFTRNQVLFILCLAALVFSVFTAFFFRDPDREPSKERPLTGRTVLSPADGTVIEVAEDEENDFIKGKVTRVSIFLSIFNVHVNRIPISGRVEHLVYRKGKFHAAFNSKASEENEQSIIGLQTSCGKMLFKQIAGAIARRVIYYLSEGDEVNAGARFGIIRFGSRVDIMIPIPNSIFVKKGDRVASGHTLIGELNEC